MNIKNLILKNKKAVTLLIVSMVFGFIGGREEMPKAEYQQLIVQKDEINKESILLDEEIKQINFEIEQLEQKIEAERLAKEEAERLAKEEAERLAKEEAERLAKEEAKRLAKEQASKEQDKRNQEVNQETKNEMMVWVANSTTEVYHSRSSCSNMKSPTKMSLENAKSRGLRKCKKC